MKSSFKAQLESYLPPECPQTIQPTWVSPSIYSLQFSPCCTTTLSLGLGCTTSKSCLPVPIRGQTMPLLPSPSLNYRSGPKRSYHWVCEAKLPRFPHLLISQTAPADWTGPKPQFLWKHVTQDWKPAPINLLHRSQEVPRNLTSPFRIPLPTVLSEPRQQH